jgi:hypothetical protein
MADIRALDVKTKEKPNIVDNILKIETSKLKYPNDDEKASRICTNEVTKAGTETGKQVREVFHIDAVEMITERDATDSPMSPGRLIEFDQDQEKSCYGQKGVTITARKDSPPISPVTAMSTSYPPKK